MLHRLFPKEVDYLWSRLALATRGRESLGPLWSRGSDPRVTRLVESAAYVFARVAEKLEDDLPEVSHPIVSCALPELLRPTPSATIVQLGDVGGDRLRVVEEAALQIASYPVEGVPCAFTTCWPITTAPISLKHAQVRALEDGVQALTLRITAYPGMDLGIVLPDALRLFVHTKDPFHALDLVHAIHASRTAPRARWLDERGLPLRATHAKEVSVRWTALDHPPRVGGARYDRFASGTALRTLFSFPEAFAFFDITGLKAFRGTRGQGHALELIFDLARPVRPSLFDARFELDCAPAFNVFSTTVTLDVNPLGGCQPISLPDRPGAEVFAIQEARLTADADPNRVLAVRFWEEQGPPHPYERGDLYLRLERREPLPGRGVELRPWLLRLTGPANVPRSRLRIHLLATDGHRTERLGIGSMRFERGAARLSNLTRVTPPRSCLLGERLPWRLNAYARMSVLQFATKRSLGAYVRLHDRSPRASAPDVSGVLAVKRRAVHRVVGTEVHHGEEVDVGLDENVLGGRGAAWLVGRFLADALAERADLLRYTRTRWVAADGSVEADYEVQTGQRLPPPFG